MLSKLGNALGLGEAETTARPARASAFREMLERASKTETAEPVAVVRRLHSLDQLAKRTLSLTPTVIEAQVKLDKLQSSYRDAVEEANAYLEKLKEEFEAQITAAEIDLAKACTERKRSQYNLIRQQIDVGCFEGIDDLNALSRSKEFKEESA